MGAFFGGPYHEGLTVSRSRNFSTNTKRSSALRNFPKKFQRVSRYRRNWQRFFRKGRPAIPKSHNFFNNFFFKAVSMQKKFTSLGDMTFQKSFHKKFQSQTNLSSKFTSVSSLNRALDILIQSYLRSEKSQGKQKAAPRCHHPIVDCRTDEYGNDPK